MERQKYISLVAELRQIVIAKALTLLDDHDAAEDVAGEVLMKLWERHETLGKRDGKEPFAERFTPAAPTSHYANLPSQGERR